MFIYSVDGTTLVAYCLHMQPITARTTNQSNMQTTIATEILPAPSSLDALAILIKAIKLSNNGYIFAPSPYEATVA